MGPYMFLLLPADPSLYDHASGVVRSPHGDVGVDIPFPEDVVVPPGEVVLVDLGVKAVCIKELRWEGGGVSKPWAYRMVPRSSISKTPLMMANSEGIIDPGYRGSLKAAVRNVTSAAYTIKKGTALFQLVFPDLSPYVYSVLGGSTAEAYFGEGTTKRGAGGFGSTGASGSADAAVPATTD